MNQVRLMALAVVVALFTQAAPLAGQTLNAEEIVLDATNTVPGFFNTLIHVVDDDFESPYGPFRIAYLHDDLNNAELVFRVGKVTDISYGLSPSFRLKSGAQRSSLVIAKHGNGIGTEEPEVPLHVTNFGEFDGDPSALVKIENKKELVAVRNLLTLENNGGARFALKNNSTGKRWIISTNNNDTLFWTEANSADTSTAPFFRMFLNDNNHNILAQMGLLTGGTKFDLRTNGNLQIAGNLTESSDRNKKEHFNTVDVQKVLQAVVGLPITTWTYKHDDDSIRHMGPMAQDFRAAFGLGKNDTSIAGIDKDGVALAAIKGLHQTDQKKDARILELENRLDDLEQMMHAVLNRVER